MTGQSKGKLTTHQSLSQAKPTRALLPQGIRTASQGSSTPSTRQHEFYAARRRPAVLQEKIFRARCSNKYCTVLPSIADIAASWLKAPADCGGCRASHCWNGSLERPRRSARRLPTDSTSQRAKARRANDEACWSNNQRPRRASSAVLKRAWQSRRRRRGQRILHPTHSGPLPHAAAAAPATVPAHSCVGLVDGGQRSWVGAHRPATPVLLCPIQRSQDQFFMHVAALVRVSAVRTHIPVPQTAPTHPCIQLRSVGRAPLPPYPLALPCPTLALLMSCTSVRLTKQAPFCAAPERE